MDAKKTASTGSSPLARGTLTQTAAEAWFAGLIPARAGNTFFLEMAGENGWAHPRSRGEHSNTAWNQAINAGSSPLARGTLTTEEVPIGGLGLIPARAGNTKQLNGS